MKRSAIKRVKPSTLKHKCDATFGRIVRARGVCARCGSTKDLQCAHVVSRSFSHTRCDPRNAWCLCARCHWHLTKEPYEHVAFAHATIGEATYASLRALALTQSKVDWSAVLSELEILERGLA